MADASGKSKGSNRGSKAKYTSLQKRMAAHIEESTLVRTKGDEKAAGRIAWATINKRFQGAPKSHGGSGVDDISAFLDTLDLKHLTGHEKSAFEAELRHARKQHSGDLEALMGAEDAICDRYEEIAHTRMAHEAVAGKLTSAHHLDELGSSGRHEHLGTYGKASVPHSTKGKGAGQSKGKEAAAGGAGGSAVNTEDEADDEPKEAASIKGKVKGKDEAHLTGSKRARGGSLDSEAATGEDETAAEGTAKKKARAATNKSGKGKAGAGGADKLRRAGSAAAGKAH